MLARVFIDFEKLIIWESCPLRRVKLESHGNYRNMYMGKVLGIF